MSTLPLPPGPRDWAPVGIYKLWHTDPLHYMAQAVREYGDLAFLEVGRYRLALVNHPDYVQDVLVTHRWNFTPSKQNKREWHTFLGEGLLTSTSEYHAHERRLIEPAFKHEHTAGWGAIMADYARRQGEHWTDGTSFDMHQEMLRLTLAIAAKVFLNADVDSAVADDVGRAVNMAYEFNSLLKMPFAGLLEHLPLPPVRHFHQAIEILERVVRQQMDARRAAPPGDDLMSRLMRAPQMEAGVGRMSDARVRDEMMTILLAGHETMANSLTFTWRLLAQYPEAEARLHEEVDRVLAGRLPTAADIPNLPYTEALFAESMRLYPPAWVQGRSSVVEYELAGYRIPAETLVMWSLWNIHRDPRWWTDPDKFEPERMLRPARAGRHRFAYFPFGGGPRQCIGELFAWTEGVLVLATLAQTWRLRLPADHELTLEPMVTLRPKGGVAMIAERRVIRH